MLPGSLEPQKAGNSIGVFLNEGEFEAVVLRIEAPVLSLFGVTIPGAGRPIIHFQYAKGSEIQRRRESILRERTNGGPWIPVSSVAFHYYSHLQALICMYTFVVFVELQQSCSRRYM